MPEAPTNQDFVPTQNLSAPNEADNDLHSWGISQSQTLASQANTASSNPFATQTDIDDLKTSLQEIRSLLSHIPTARHASDSTNELRDDDIHGRRYSSSISHYPKEVVEADFYGIQKGPMIIEPRPGSLRSRSRSPGRAPSPIPPSASPMVIVQPRQLTRRTDFTTQELDSVISDFSSIVIIATFLASVSLAMLNLAHSLSLDQETSINRVLHVVLQIFTSLSLSFNLSVAIIAGSAASSQSLRLRLGQRATEFSQNQALDTKLQLCTTLQYYGLLTLTVGTACLFGLLLNSPYAILMIIPVMGVIFYDSLYRNRFGYGRLEA